MQTNYIKSVRTNSNSHQCQSTVNFQSDSRFSQKNLQECKFTTNQNNISTPFMSSSTIKQPPLTSLHLKDKEDECFQMYQNRYCQNDVKAVKPNFLQILLADDKIKTSSEVRIPNCPKKDLVSQLLNTKQIPNEPQHVSTSFTDMHSMAGDYHSDTSNILFPELNLIRLGYAESNQIDWQKVYLPEKRDLYIELRDRILNKKHTDCKVYVEKEEFSCHLMVLQSYSEMIDGLEAFKKLELMPDKCNATSFAVIYNWMITGNSTSQLLTRTNVLDLFIAGKYLQIKDLVEQCWAFIDNVDIFNENSAFILYTQAKEKKMEEIKQLMLPRIQTFFLALVGSEDWINMDVEDLKSFLSSNYIRVNSEMEVFGSAVRWLKYNWQARWEFRIEIIQCVRFGNMPAWQLIDIKRNPINSEYLQLAEDSDVCKLIDEGLAYATMQQHSQNNAIQQLSSILNLRKPHPRHWTGDNIVHLTYKDFLIYLHRYRKNQLLEKNKVLKIRGDYQMDQVV